MEGWRAEARAGLARERGREMQDDKRVVITGIGAITSIGLNVGDFWKNLVDGKAGISEIESFDTSAYERTRGGEIKDFDPLQFMASSVADGCGRGSQMAIAAAKEAIGDSGLDIEEMDPFRVGVSFGTTMGEPQELEQIDRDWLKGGVHAIDPLQPQRYPAYVIPRNVAKIFGFCGPNVMLPNACAAGNFAMGYGYDLICSGRADMMVVGGADPFSLPSCTTRLRSHSGSGSS